MTMRIFKLLAVAATMLFACMSCMKDTERNYSFSSICSTNNTVSQEDFEAMTACVKKVAYFTGPHSYFGFYNDAVQLAAKDFMKACEDLDEKTIKSYLKKDEAFSVILVSNGTGEMLLTCFISPSGDEQ